MEKNNKKSPISNSINYEYNKQKLNRINAFQTNKTIKDIKFSKSGKNLRYQNFSKAKLTNSENIIKKSSEVIKEPKTFYIDINKLSPKNLKKSLNNTTFTSPKESVESYLYNNTSNDIDSFNILDNFRKGENYHKERLSLPFNTTFNTIMEKEFNIFDLEKK